MVRESCGDDGCLWARKKFRASFEVVRDMFSFLIVFGCSLFWFGLIFLKLETMGEHLLPTEDDSDLVSLVRSRSSSTPNTID